ncbi:hypothetical protein BYT27DRAFT_7092042, partial [Phlegmacium glaucopus]
LSSATCIPGCVQEFVSKWQAGISRLQSAKFPFSIKLCISQFVHSLPHVPTYNTLCADLPNCIAAASDHYYGAFIVITENVLELETIFQSVQHPHCPARTLPASQGQPLSPQKPNSNIVVPAGTERSTTTPQICGNCGKPGHSVPTCFTQVVGWRDNAVPTRGIKESL